MTTWTRSDDEDSMAMRICIVAVIELACCTDWADTCRLIAAALKVRHLIKHG